MIRLTASIVPALLITRDVGSNLHRDPVRTSACSIDHALVGSSAITIDLMQGHHNLSARRDLRKGPSILCHNRLRTGLNVVLTGANGLAARGGVGALEACAVLLEGVASLAVTRRGWIDCEYECHEDDESFEVLMDTYLQWHCPRRPDRQ